METFPNFEQVFQKIAHAIEDLQARLVEAFSSIVAALRDFAFRLLPHWYYIQTHFETDPRYIASPVSKSLTEIFYPHAPPDFIALN